MGSVTSKDTRRISFDNNIELSLLPPIPIAITKDRDLAIECFQTSSEEDLPCKGNSKSESTGNLESAYWSQRIETLKKEHHMINKIIESEYEKTIQQTLSQSPDMKSEEIHEEPDTEWRSKITKCYEENYHQPLQCSHLVKEFREYANTCRFEERESCF